MNKKCIIICGPTASGKTDAAINAAQYFGTQIISADSRQCYKELNIGVAKPTLVQLYLVPHYFINTHSITENVTAADYEKYAMSATEKIFLNKDEVIVCGGTGLYIKAFTDGLDDIEPVDEKIKKDINNNYKTLGIEWLKKQLEMIDPVFFERGEMQNPHRMLRALEVKLTTGESILLQQKKIKKIRNFKIIKIGIEVSRDELYDRINNRVNEMIGVGLVDEVKELLYYKDLKALQTVGYSELFQYFEGGITLPKAIDLIKQHTRNYAKRQLTWFKKDEEVIWLPKEKIQEYITQIN